MLLPHRPLLLLLSVWLVLALPAIRQDAWLALWKTVGVLLFAVAALDAGVLLRRGNPVWVERETRPVWPLGQAQTIRLRLHSPARRAAGWVYDHHPAAFPADPMPLQFQLKPGAWVDLGYVIRPTERGDHHFQGTALRLLSPLGLWLAQYRIGRGETVRVYPDFARVAEYSLLATDHRLSQFGLLLRRRRGEGLEFHQLREYQRDDPLRRIDWKATARKRKPIAREYQDERDQNIVFLLDCGQRMRSRDGDLSHFDHSLNAMLLLAYVALRQGDAVGLATFAHPAPGFLAPRKSLGTLQRLLDFCYGLQASLQTPDYLTASLDLGGRLGKRSLVVVLTNLRDEDDDTLPPALRSLGRRHLVLLANLRETALETLLNEPIDSFDQALTHAAGLEYRSARRRQLARLRAGGIRVLDAAPPELAVVLVNRYWEMKRGGVI